MSLYNVFKNLFIMRLTRNPMIALAWWLWGKTPANLLARSAFALVCFTAFRHRQQLSKIWENPRQAIDEFTAGFTKAKKAKKRPHPRLKNI